MSAQLVNQFAVSTVMVVLCVAIHGFGLFALNRALRSEASIERLRRLEPVSPRGVRRPDPSSTATRWVWRR